MTDEGFVWLEEPETADHAADRGPRWVSRREPSEDVAPTVERRGTAEPTRPRAHPDPRQGPTTSVRDAALGVWRPARRPALVAPMVAVARAALRGRRALLGACLELCDALSGELRHRLLAS